MGVPAWLCIVLFLLPFVSSNSEGDALYALRRSLTDPDNVLQSWDPTLVNPCTWFHITCNQDNRVTRVDLGNSNLSGHLVPDLGKLEHLQYLELYKNHISGTIPSEWGNLKSLVSLDLYNNNISGTIPRELGKLKSLVFLRLNNNRISGKIPRELASILCLKVLDVSSNNLCGTIPTTGPFEHIPLNKQEVLLLDNEIAFNEAIIKEREQGIQEIQQQIGEVNEIFKDLAVLVHEQGVMIDDIDSNIESSYAATSQGKQQLAKASKTQKSNSSLACLLLVIFGVVLLIVIIVLVA